MNEIEKLKFILSTNADCELIEDNRLKIYDCCNKNKKLAIYIY